MLPVMLKNDKVANLRVKAGLLFSPEMPEIASVVGMEGE
jgi:hypothetical protein